MQHRMVQFYYIDSIYVPKKDDQLQACRFNKIPSTNRIRLAQEQALKNLEKDSDIIRYGLQANPELYRAGKKMYDVNCSTESFQVTA